MTIFAQLDSIPPLDSQYGVTRLLSGEQSMIVFATMKAGVHIAMHKHPNEQTTWLRSGRMEFGFATGERKMFGPGALILVPGGVEHEVWYHEECEIAEFFSPPRFDLYPAARLDPHGIAPKAG